MSRARAFVFLSVATTFFGAPLMAENEAQQPIPGVHGVALDEASIRRLSDLALDGSGEAARKLAIHYQVAAYDPEKALYWAIIAAENRDVVGQYTAGFLLKDDPDPRQRRRAIFWLKKAAEQGSEPAETLLMELEEADEK